MAEQKVALQDDSKGNDPRLVSAMSNAILSSSAPAALTSMGQAAPVAGNKNNRRSLDSPSKQPAASSPLSGGSLAALGASGELSAENVSTGRIKELLANAGKRLAVLNRGKVSEVAAVELASDDDASAASADAGIKQRNGNAPNGQTDDAAVFGRILRTYY